MEEIKMSNIDEMFKQYQSLQKDLTKSKTKLSQLERNLRLAIASKIDKQKADLAKLDSMLKERNLEGVYSLLTGQEIVTSDKDFWRVSGVEYRNGIYTVDLLKSLLDSGKRRTQDGWAKYSERAIKKGEFRVGDFPLYHSLFTALFKQKDKPESKEARAFIEKQMKDYWLTTLTRISYQPRGKDRIIHNYGTCRQYGLEENIVGPDRYIKSADGAALNAILGTGNIQEIKKVYNWICNRSPYIWRRNQRLESIDDRVAGFGASSGRAGLDCCGNPQSSGFALGVFACAEGTKI